MATCKNCNYYEHFQAENYWLGFCRKHGRNVSMTELVCEDFNDCRFAVSDNGELTCLYYEDAPGNCQLELCPKALGESEGGV